MRGDFSRYRFDPSKHYTAVLEQQGRVQLDADANEQRAIDAHRSETETIDVIGVTGAPAHAAGFAISLRSDNTSLLIGPGRFYVGGLPCEMAAETDYTQQPFLIGPQPGIAAMLNDLRAGRVAEIRVWLEAWQRLATPIDDPCIRDVALGEADTTVRVQTVWRVVADAVAPTATGQAAVAEAVQALGQSIASHQRATRSSGLAPVAARAEALAAEVATGTSTSLRLAAALADLHASAAAAVARLKLLPAGTAAELAASVDGLASARGAILQEDCCAAMRRTPVRFLAGEMTAATDDTADLGPCLPSPQAAYRGLENQLYRIEVHQGGALADATFKWSRDNGSVLARILHVGGKVITVDTLGPDANLGFAPLQWVEISDDGDEFGPIPNQPGQLRLIQSVDFEHNRITLTEVAPAVDTANGHAKLRRWDHTDPAATNAAIPMGAGAHRLENGIQVRFSDARPFRAGDFWQVPARTASGELEWPPCGSDGADYEPARNVLVRRAPLACLHWEPKAGGFVPQDCRDLFYPLTELAPPPLQAALHVTAINWTNDDVQTLDQLQANGLSVTLDAPPEARIDPARFSVTLEFPLSFDEFRPVGFATGEAGLLRNELVVDGAIAVKGNVIAWSLPSGIYFYLLQALDQLDGFANRQEYARARVRLRGGMLRGGGPGAARYLDGQCFAGAATRADGKTPRSDLILPSGAAAKASDFESWFELAPLPRVAALSVTPAAVAWVPIPGAVGLRLVDAADPKAAASPVLNLSLNYDALADTRVALTVSGGTLGVVTAPATVVVPRGATAPVHPVPLTVGNPGAVTQVFTVAANVILASGIVYPMQTTLTVSGQASPGRVPVFTAPFPPLPDIGPAAPPGGNG